MTLANVTAADRRGNIVRVETTDGTTQMLSVTEPLGLVFELELADLFAEDGVTYINEDPSIGVGLDADGSFVLEYEAASWTLSGQDAVSVVRAVDTFERTGSTEPLRQIHRAQTDTSVRTQVVNAFVPCIDAEVTVTGEGWVIDDLLVLTWDGRLTPFSGSYDSPDAWSDEQWQLYGFTNVDTTAPSTSITVNGATVQLKEHEWSFVQRAAWAANRESFGDSAGLYDAYWRNVERAVERGGLRVVDEREDNSASFFESTDPIIGTSDQLFGDATTTRPAIPESDNVTPVYEQARDHASSFNIGSYRSHTSGEPHSHRPTNHDARDVFNLSDTLIADVLHFSPKDHGVLHELITRQDALIRDSVPVFTDTEDWTDNRWEAIEGETGHAHIRDEARVYLETVFDY